MSKTEAVLRLMSIPLLEWDGKEEVGAGGGIGVGNGGSGILSAASESNFG
jgi:hypothetical protein